MLVQQTSIGHWFKSGSREEYFFILSFFFVHTVISFFFAVENVIHGQLTERNARRFQIFSVSTPVMNSSIV